MGTQAATFTQRRSARGDSIANQEYLLRQGILKLLAVKDSDIRALTLEQRRDAVDQGLHAGGAFSATIPLVALFYGGFIDYDVADPTRRGQDMFTLSKGHAVAALASILCRAGLLRPVADARLDIWQNFLKALYRHRKAGVDQGRVFTINTLDAEGRAQFIHSGTSEELTEAFGLTAPQIAGTIRNRVKL